MKGEAREIQLDGVGNREKPCRSNIKTGQMTVWRKERRKGKEEGRKREVYRKGLGLVRFLFSACLHRESTSEFFALTIFLRRKSVTAGRTAEMLQHHFRGYCRCY